jgi:hypothetical protein
LEELGYVMKMLGHKVSEPQLKQIMQIIDENGNGIFYFSKLTYINYFHYFKGNGVIDYQVFFNHSALIHLIFFIKGIH